MEKKRILVLSPYSFLPPQYGGHRRSSALYANPYEKFNVITVCLNWAGEFKVHKTSENFQNGFVVDFPAGTTATITAANYLPNIKSGSWDMMIPLTYLDLQEFQAFLDDLINDCDLILLSHPWMCRFVLKSKVPVWLDCHNVEQDAFAQYYGENSIDARLVKVIEDKALSIADGVLTCTNDDEKRVRELGFEGIIKVIPNGTEKPKSRLMDFSSRTKTVVFAGSGHYPNIEAANRFVELSKHLVDFQFVITGDVCGSISDIVPKNVKKLGYISDENLGNLLGSSFALVNPVNDGSGSHLKTIQALAHGLPVLTTLKGTRGLNEHTGNGLYICSTIEDYIQRLHDLESENSWKSASRNSIQIAELYEWNVIRKSFEETIDSSCISESKIYETNWNLQLSQPNQILWNERKWVISNLRRLASPFWNKLTMAQRTLLFKLILRRISFKRVEKSNFNEAVKLFTDQMK